MIALLTLLLALALGATSRVAAHSPPPPTTAASPVPSPLPSVSPSAQPQPQPLSSPVSPSPVSPSPVPSSPPPMHSANFMPHTNVERYPLPLATVGPATAAYAYRFVPGQPSHLEQDQPQIFAVYLNAKALHSQGPIDIRVVTSGNVVKVTSSSNGRAGTVAQIGPGDFQAHSKLPKLPRIVTGITTTLDFTAVSATGKKVTVGVPIQLQ